MRLHFDNDFLEIVRAFKSHAQLVVDFPVNAQLCPNYVVVFIRAGEVHI